MRLEAAVTENEEFLFRFVTVQVRSKREREREVRILAIIRRVEVLQNGLRPVTPLTNERE